MSLPLTRRIARAALLIAAGTVPVVGAAGSASAVELQQANPLGALTALDSGALSGAVDGAAQKTSNLADSTGNNTVKETVPAAAKTVGQAGEAAAPAAQKAAGEVTGTASSTLGRATGSTGESLGGLPTGQLGSTLPADQLPLKGLPLG
ncbi:ATP-binding protein [Streptomyces sp. NBC_00690]|uniref:ATP-binding protein n=1 Tax=Streptomyces sp. NBC_00690 TaxID=2975808 RepID=UPI002E2BFFEB|nr:ATP-binding protein [Streptomyces sp. NBC_00690]